MRSVFAAALALVALAAAPAPSANAADLSIAVAGNRLVDGAGQPVRLIGVDRSGTEYACAGDDGSGGHGYGIFAGPVSNRAIQAMETWHINAVALATMLGGLPLPGGTRLLDVAKFPFSEATYDAELMREIREILAEASA